MLTGRVAEVAALINSPPAQSGAATTTNNSLGEEIVVTACPRSGCDPRTSLAHDAAAGIGSYYNDGSSFRRTVIDAGIGVVSGGPAGYVFGEVAGALQSQILPARAQELLGNLSTAVNVGVDSFFQGRSFGTVGTENANRDNTFQSHNATTGAGLIIQAIPGTRAVFRGRGRGSSSSSRRPERARTCSFHGDTFVRTLMGMTPIKDIVPGKDQVWAQNPLTGAMGYGTVERQITSNYEVTVRAEVRDSETGAMQVIVSNTIHPYFVQLPEGASAPPSSERHVYDGKISRGAWIDASNLKAGYRLLNDDGSWAEVTGLTVEQVPLKAYNLTIAGYHTFFVSGNVTAKPVWVHNNNCDIAQNPRVPNEPKFKTDKSAREQAVENGWEPTNFRSSGAQVFFDRKSGLYFTRDRTGHTGGSFKGGKSPKDLGPSKRSGTYDKFGNWVRK